MFTHVQYRSEISESVHVSMWKIRVVRSSQLLAKITNYMFIVYMYFMISAGLFAELQVFHLFL